MNTIKKIISTTLLSAALAIGTVVGGMSLHSVTASAEEIMPAVTVTVDTPTEKITRRYGAVQYHYTGDSTDGTTYIHLGTNSNPNYGYKTYYGYEYNVAIVPDVGASSVILPYYWIQAFVVTVDDTYSSSRVYTTRTTQYSKNTVTGSIISDELTTSYTTKTYSTANSSDVYYTCVYDGVTKHGSCSIPETGKTTTATVKFDDELTFTVIVGRGTIKVKTSKKVTCNQTSETGTGYAAFAYTVE